MSPSEQELVTNHGIRLGRYQFSFYCQFAAWNELIKVVRSTELPEAVYATPDYLERNKKVIIFPSLVIANHFIELSTDTTTVL